MKRHDSDRGPLLPGEASMVLKGAAGLIGLAGILTFLRVIMILYTVFSGPGLGALAPMSYLILGLAAGLGVVCLIAAIWLLEARKSGGYLGIAVLLLDVVLQLVAPYRPTTLGVLMPVVALVGLAFAWQHLSDSGRDVNEHLSITPQAR